MTAPSLCTSAYFRQYFQNGTLPAPGTVCAADITLFGAPAPSRRDALSAEEEELLAALKVISKAVRPVITSKTIH
jgi:hypothetical protein